MTDALSKHTFDEEYHKKAQKKAEQRNRDRKQREQEEEEKKKTGLNFAQAAKSKEYACYKCGKKDHPLRECPLKLDKKDSHHN